MKQSFRNRRNTMSTNAKAEVDHFMFAEDNFRAIEILRGWLDRYFPVRDVG